MIAALDWMDAFGRWHPVLLHLPIGLLVALAWLRLLRVDANAVERSLLWLLAISSVGAAATGWLLHEAGGYGDPVELHEWLGIAVTALCLVLVWVHGKRPLWYTRVLFGTVLLLIPTAHFGATLTHGPDFLTEPWFEKPEETEVVATPSQQAEARFDAVQPILASRCGRCHGERKRKGGLALHSLVALGEGGDSGASVVFGSPQDSELMRRLELPLEHDDHMPPANKQQLNAAEVEALRAWIAGGELSPVANLGDVGAAGDPMESVVGALDDLPELVEPDLRLALDRLREDGVFVQPTAQEARTLSVDFAGAGAAGEMHVTSLGTLRHHVVSVSLAGRTLPTGMLDALGQMPNLTELNLSRLPGDQPVSLEPLRGATALSRVVLSFTKVAEDAVEVMAQWPALQQVTLTGVGWSAASVESLRSRTSAVVVAAVKPPATVVEQETEVAFVEAVPLPAAGLAASNAVCPVKGAPVDTKFRLVFEERVIGFCCAKCLAAFVADPEEFRAELPGK